MIPGPITCLIEYAKTNVGLCVKKAKTYHNGFPFTKSSTNKNENSNIHIIHIPFNQ